MPKIKIEADVPDGLYCDDKNKSCELAVPDYANHFIGKDMGWKCLGFKVTIQGTAWGNDLLKCPACLAACEEAERKRKGSGKEGEMKPKKVKCKDCEAAQGQTEEEYKCHRYALRAEAQFGGFFPAIGGQDAWCMEGIEKEKKGKK